LVIALGLILPESSSSSRSTFCVDALFVGHSTGADLTKLIVVKSQHFCDRKKTTGVVVDISSFCRLTTVA
jgi:hypothetical protein